MKLYISTFFILLFTFSFSQIQYKERVELDLDDNFKDEKLYTFKENGFVIVTENKHKINKEKEWKLDLYNTKVQKVKTQKIRLHKKFNISEHLVTSNRFYQLFINNKGNCQLYYINFSDLSMDVVNFKIHKKHSIEDIIAFQNKIVLFTYQNKKPVLVYINPSNKTMQTLAFKIEGHKGKHIKFQSIQKLSSEEEIFTIIESRKKRKETFKYIYTLDKNFNFQNCYQFKDSLKEKIQDISFTKISDHDYTMCGTYKEKRGPTNGIFFSRFIDNEIQHLNFYNYLDLNNFINYMSEKKQERIEKKKKKKERKNKSYSLSYYIKIHDVITSDSNFILIGESYYPTYTYQTYSTTSNGITTTHTVQIFDGYQYNHAFIAKFHPDGKLLWDESFELTPSYKPMKVKEFLQVKNQPQDIIKLTYASNNEIVTKVLSIDGQVIEKSNSEPIELTYENDDAKRTASNLDYWYSDYFIAHGSQKIKNKVDEEVDKKRFVFFISKIKF